MRLLRAAPLGALFLLGFAVGLSAPARAQFACPADFQDQSAPITCTCSAEAVAAGSVWGSGVYTSDSNICLAARHAGAVGEQGGAVTVTPAPGRSAYSGTRANGVESASYGAWDRSFTVAAATQEEASAAAPPACPASFEQQSAPLACSCSAQATGIGEVWGTGAYSSDSSICRAARHAGIIPAEGGTVQVIPAPGMPSYAGTTANGVTSLSYGAWGASFTFRR
ncbi:MAG: hypothetical protein IRZ13_17845 [Acetobacteraceae bacterium]|nr:hypothetical protein [Acetobacteraceae bacterium]